MDIRTVNSGNQEVYSIKKRDDLNKKYGNQLPKNEESLSASKDSLVLSDEALKLQPIKQRIESGYYNNPEVFNDVALKLNDLLAEDKL